MDRLDLYTPRSTITGKMVDRRPSLSLDLGRISVASNFSNTMDLTYRDYWGPPKYTPFDEKFIELDFLKYRTKAHTRKLNALKLNYMDWFKRKCQSFLDGVKLTQIMAAKLLPAELETMKDFKKVHDMSRRFPRNGTPRDANPGKMDDFFMFWSTMITLKEETDDIYESTCKYCETITRLRKPGIKDDIDLLKKRLDEVFNEEFLFTDLKNERDNLFVYKVAPFDYTFHGLMGYIPYLLSLSVRLLTSIGKLHLEKE